MATAFEQVKAVDAFGSPADVTAALLGTGSRLLDVTTG